MSKKAKRNGVAGSLMRILGYGGAFIDVVYRVPEEFVAGLQGAKGGSVNCTWDEQDAIIAAIPEECRKSLKRRAGGGVGNTMRKIASETRINLKVAMCAVVGDDVEGSQYISELESENVDVRRVRRVPGAHTGRCLSLVTPDGERTMYTFQGVNQDLGKYCPLNKSDFNGVTAFYTEGYMLIDEPMMRRTLDIARANDEMEIHFDVGSVGVITAHQDFMRTFLPPRVDFLYANYDEACALTGATIPEDIINLLGAEFPCPLVKLGKDGAICIDRATMETVQVPCEEKPLEGNVDTTGAGDTWAGAFIWAHLVLRRPVDCCVDWANVQTYDFLKYRMDFQDFTDEDRLEYLKKLMELSKDGEDFSIDVFDKAREAVLAEKKAQSPEK